MRMARRMSMAVLSAVLVFPVGTSVAGTPPGWRVDTVRASGDDASLWKRVSALGDDDIWVAGLVGYDITTSTGVPAVSHWDGEAWRTRVFDDMHESSDVNGLSAVATDDVWLSLREYGAKRYLHFDGTEWTSLPTGGSGKWSNSVAALPGTAWTIANARVVARFDGTGWERTRIAKHGRFADISASADDDVWVVGNAEDVPKRRPAKRFEPLAKHWDGERWKRTPVPVEDCSLTDVVALAIDSAWAQCVRRDRHGGAKSFTVLRWDGVRWRTAFGPVESFSIKAFTANVDGQVWVGGTEQMWHFDGHGWTVGSLPGPKDGDVPFGGRDANALAAIPGTDQAVAVGTVYVDSVDATLHPRRDLVWRTT